MYIMEHDGDIQRFYYTDRKDIQFYVTQNMENVHCRYERTAKTV